MPFRRYLACFLLTIYVTAVLNHGLAVTTHALYHVMAYFALDKSNHPFSDKDSGVFHTHQGNLKHAHSHHPVVDSALDAVASGARKSDAEPALAINFLRLLTHVLPNVNASALAFPTEARHFAMILIHADEVCLAPATPPPESLS